MSNGGAHTPGPAAQPKSHVPRALIDMHCHVFNASDLPVVSFIRLVVRHRYGSSGTATDLLIGYLAEILTGNAPRAGDELADLKGEDRPPIETFPPASDSIGTPMAPAAHAPRSPPSVYDTNPEESPAVGPQANTYATDASLSGGNLSRLIKWIRLFNRSRLTLIKILSGMYESKGQQCVLMAPALVDYNVWLRDPEKKHQRLTDQVAVMGAIARQPGKTRVHGFVGFDPLRAFLHREGRTPAHSGLPSFDPHKLVEDAVSDHGFLGVKLYPPMGFRAWNNASPHMKFPKKVKDEVRMGISDRDLGRIIDYELKKLYLFCANNGVPILAHTYNSNESDKCYGWRATPQYWKEAIENVSTPEKPLRVCLAHLCSFDAHTTNSACRPPDTIADAWESTFGRILQDPKGQYAFADLSYFQELLDREDGWRARRQKILDQFKSFLHGRPENIDHLCYGSDWIMLGFEKRYEHHHEEVAQFLHDAGCLPADIGKVFFGNAVRFLGLGAGDKNRERLEKFYDDNNIRQYFPQFDAMA